VADAQSLCDSGEIQGNILAEFRKDRQATRSLKKQSKLKRR